MSLNVGEVMNAIARHLALEFAKDTADTLKSGDTSMEVTGIAITFMATVDVIRKAFAIGANMIITHEPTFYNGKDQIDELLGSEVYNYKCKLLEDSKIAVLRMHDCLHKRMPDAIVDGMARKMGWSPYKVTGSKYIFDIPQTTVLKLIESLKSMLNIQTVRFTGNPEIKCRRVGLLVGAASGNTQIRLLAKENIDVLICGEATEWEAAEYVRDALAIGANKAMIIIGHANSEEPGMEHLAEELKNALPDIPVTFIPAGNPLNFL